jgi:hypothetical protein
VEFNNEDVHSLRATITGVDVTAAFGVLFEPDFGQNAG